MHHDRFDTLARRWHAGVTRRQGLAALIAGLATAGRAGAIPAPAAAAQCLGDGDRCGGHHHPPCRRCCSHTSKKRSGGGKKCVCRRQGDACDANRQCCSRACGNDGTCVDTCIPRDEFCDDDEPPVCCVGYACDYICRPGIGTSCEIGTNDCAYPLICNAENKCAEFCVDQGRVCLNGRSDCCLGLDCVNAHCCWPAGEDCDGRRLCCPGLTCIDDVCTA